jgi:hypothetical protein
VVNKRAFLSPLDVLATSTGLDITIILPKLHPKYESRVGIVQCSPILYENSFEEELEKVEPRERRM